MKMQKSFIQLYILVILLLPTFGLSQETITFPSADGVTITGDLYAPHEQNAPFIVLCHQAGWSRGEYIEIAPKLNTMGFNCLAIDQRSGNAVNNTANQTFKEAKKAMKQTNYLDALQDIEAAVGYAKANLCTGKLILWGSSYSAALVLKVAGQHADKIDGVLSFSPGEYFKSYGKPTDFIQQGASTIQDPAFITSARNEEGSWASIYNAIEHPGKVRFVPSTMGNHGSRALWQKFTDSTAYWAAVTDFLNQFK